MNEAVFLIKYLSHIKGESESEFSITRKDGNLWVINNAKEAWEILSPFQPIKFNVLDGYKTYQAIFTEKAKWIIMEREALE